MNDKHMIILIDTEESFDSILIHNLVIIAMLSKLEMERNDLSMLKPVHERPIVISHVMVVLVYP